MHRQEAKELDASVRTGVVEEVGAAKTLTPRDRAVAAEFATTVNDLVEDARAAARDLKAFQRARESGEINHVLRNADDEMTPDEIVDMLSGGSPAVRGERGGGISQGRIHNIEAQLRDKLRLAQDDFASSVGALVGRQRMSFSEAKKAISRGGKLTDEVERVFASMSPSNRARFEDHVRHQAILDQRRLRDIDTRMTRMGEGTGRTAVTDDPYFALTAPPSAMKDADTAMPPRDLSQLTNEGAIAPIEAEQAALAAAREQLKTGSALRTGSGHAGQPDGCCGGPSSQLRGRAGGDRRGTGTKPVRRRVELGRATLSPRPRWCAGPPGTDAVRSWPTRTTMALSRGEPRGGRTTGPGESRDGSAGSTRTWPRRAERRQARPGSGRRGHRGCGRDERAATARSTQRCRRTCRRPHPCTRRHGRADQRDGQRRPDREAREQATRNLKNVKG